MVGLDFDLKGIENGKKVFDVENYNIEFIYNSNDGYIYLSILDDLQNRLTGHNRVVPNIDYFGLANIEDKVQLRCIKINNYAEERDKITIDNVNKDYKFFLIKEVE